MQSSHLQEVNILHWLALEMSFTIGAQWTGGISSSFNLAGLKHSLTFPDCCTTLLLHPHLGLWLYPTAVATIVLPWMVCNAQAMHIGGTWYGLLPALTCNENLPSWQPVSVNKSLNSFYNHCVIFAVPFCKLLFILLLTAIESSCIMNITLNNPSFCTLLHPYFSILYYTCTAPLLSAFCYSAHLMFGCRWIYIRVNNPTLSRNKGNFNLHHIWDRVFLNTPGLKINTHAQDTSPIGYAHSIQPNTLMHIFTGSMEHAQRTPLSMHREPPRTYIRHWISVLPKTWWSPTVGWMKTSLNSTNVLLMRIYQPLYNTTEWEIYTKSYQKKWDRSCASTKRMGKATGKGLQLQEPLHIHA